MSMTFDDVVIDAIAILDNGDEREELIIALYDYGAFGDDHEFQKDYLKAIFYLLKNRIDAFDID